MRLLRDVISTSLAPNLRIYCKVHSLCIAVASYEAYTV